MLLITQPEHVVELIAAALIGLCICYFLCKWLYDLWIHRKLHYPPGPYALPLLGNVLSMRNLDRYTTHLAERYGDICMIKLGTKHCVILNDFALAKAHFKRKELQNHGFVSSKNIRSFIDLNGEEMWHRRHTIYLSYHTLLSTDNLLQFVTSNDLFEHQINPKGTGEICIFKNINYYVFKLIFQTVFGRTILKAPAFDSEEYQRFDQTISRCHDNATLHMTLSLLFDQTGSILGSLYDRFAPFPTSMQALTNLIAEWVDQYERTELEHVQQPETCCIQHMFRRMADTKSKFRYSKKNVVDDVCGIFMTSLVTLVMSSMMCLIYAATYTEMQDTIRSLGPKSYYFRAFISESLRMTPAIRFGFPRSIIDEDVKIGEYDIPKNAFVMANLIHISRHCEGGESDGMNLKHFLDEKTHKYKHHKVFSHCTFGFGPRNCVGKDLAVRFLNTFVGHLLAQYSIQLAPSCKAKQIPRCFGEHVDAVQNFSFIISTK